MAREELEDHGGMLLPSLCPRKRKTKDARIRTAPPLIQPISSLHPSSNKCEAICVALAEFALVQGHFFFYQCGTGGLGNRDYSIAQSPSGDAGCGIHLRIKEEILGESKRRNKVGGKAVSDFCASAGCHAGKKEVCG